MQTFKQGEKHTQQLVDKGNDLVHIKPTVLIKSSTDMIGELEPSFNLSNKSIFKKARIMLRKMWYRYCKINRLFIKYHTMSHIVK